MLSATQRTPLPSWGLDLIAHGIEADDGDRRPVFRATHQLACSAIVHGYTETDFLNVLKDGIKTGGPKPSTGLWDQLTTRRGRKVKWETVNQTLKKSWAWAQENVAKGFNPEREKDILTLAEIAHEAIPHLGLNGTEAKVLAHIANETKRRKFLDVTCPARGVAKDCGISVKGAWEALISLRDKGFIVCRSRGTWRGEKENHGGRAAIYRLSDLRHALAPAPGSRTLPSQNPSDQRDSRSITPLIGHTPPAQGAGMSKKDPYPPGELGSQYPHKGHGTLGVAR
jgi:hypothetical protein